MKNNLTTIGTVLTQTTTAQTGNQAPATSRAKSVLDRFTAACREKYQQLKDRLADELTFEFAGVVSAGTVRQAVIEASQLAATTPFPYLFLPTLAEEKVWAVSHAPQWSRNSRLTVFAA